MSGELKHTFTSGRMNKDLDDRLIPNGEYIDALNVQVSSSEGDDVGALENLLGNEKISNLGFDNPVVIGSIADNLNNKLYWFVTSDGVDAILEYDEKTKNVIPLIKDLKSSNSLEIEGVELDANSDSELIIRKYNSYILQRAFGLNKVPTILENEQEDLCSNSVVLKCSEPSINITIPKNTVIRKDENGDIVFKNINYSYSHFAQIKITLDFSDNSILNFSKLHKITGINILDDMLFWTDNLNQPRKIYIPQFRNSGIDLNAPVDTTVRFTEKTASTQETKINTRPVAEHDISVIKKSPLVAPHVEAFDSKSGGVIATKKTLNLSSYQVGNDLTIRDLDQLPEWQEGDEVVFTNTENNNEIHAIVKSISNTPFVSSVLQYDNEVIVTISSIFQEIEDKEIEYNIELKQEKAIYELQFPRFAYRWKYKTGEYSAISPFTPPVFYPHFFSFNGENGYNVGMINRLQKIILTEFDTGADTVEEIDVLFKEEKNNNIYIYDTFNKIDFDAPKPPQAPKSIEITKEKIHSVISNDQLLRAWDNVPKRAKAQEITANRIVYGNYTQNYNVYSKPDFSISVLDEPDILKRTIKSDRNYQFGVVYLDEYGRQTPVLTGKNSSKNIGPESSINTNKFRVKLNNHPPAWATHFKYYIKDNSAEYYNVAADKVYFDDVNGFAYVSFPSSERNKIAKEGYIKLKKAHGTDDAVISNDNRFKVIDVFNEPPEFVYEKLEQTGAFQNVLFAPSFGDGSTQATKKSGSTPVQNRAVIQIRSVNSDGTIDGEAGQQGIADDFKSDLAVGRFVKFAIDNEKSEAYKIKSFRYDKAGDDEAEIIFERPFEDDINFIYEDSLQNDSRLRKDIQMQFFKQGGNAGDPEFNGRFFIKIKANSVFSDAISSNIVEEDDLEYYAKYTASFDGVDRSPDNNDSVHVTPMFVRFGGLIESGTTPSNGKRAKLGNKEAHVTFQQTSPRDDAQFLKLIEVGSKIRFSNHDTIYRVGAYQTYKKEVRRKKVFETHLRFEDEDGNEQNLTSDLVANGTRLSNSELLTADLLVPRDDDKSYFTTNPAIFETEPIESKTDLDIYYETEQAFEISEHGLFQDLKWYNAFSFGNGVESNRIRDDYNATLISNGVRASAPLSTQFKEEHRFNGIIWSGIINSRSGVNQSNQFNVANTITKDLLPSYGSIQKLFARDNDIVIYCEDKIVKALADKDILYNADGSSNLVSSNRVIGNIIPFAGEYGISEVPESFAFHGFRAYNADPKRGVVIRLSKDGITVISANYMSSFFRDRLLNNTIASASYDSRSRLYNISFDGLDTVSFDENVNGWVSRRSFIPESGVSLNNRFYSYKNGELYEHDSTNVARNNFYGVQYNSFVEFAINDNPSVIKKFKTLAYEGTSGWEANSIKTDQVTGQATTFKAKENKYFANIQQEFKSSDKLDYKNFSVQGIGRSIRKTGEDDYETQIGAVANTTATFALTICDTGTNFKAPSFTKTQTPGKAIKTLSWQITAADNYTINAEDFTGDNFIFSQVSELVVNAQLSVDLLQPNEDKTFTYNICGRASRKPNKVSGSFELKGDNIKTTGAPRKGTYEVSGQPGTVHVINKRVIKPSAGYYLESDSFSVNHYKVSLKVTKLSGADEGAWQIEESIAIESADSIVDYVVTVTPKEIIIPDLKIFNKTIDTGNLPNSKASRVLSVEGEVGAEVNIIFEGPVGTEISNQTVKIGASGKENITFVFEESVSSNYNTAKTYKLKFSTPEGSKFGSNFGDKEITIKRLLRAKKTIRFTVAFVGEFSQKSWDGYVGEALSGGDFSLDIDLTDGTTYSAIRQLKNSDVRVGQNANNATFEFENLVFATVADKKVTVKGRIKINSIVSSEDYVLNLDGLIGEDITTTFAYSTNSKDGTGSGNYTAQSTTYTVDGVAGTKISPDVEQYLWTLTPSASYKFKNDVSINDFELLSASPDFDDVSSTYAKNNELVLVKENNTLKIGFSTKTFTQPNSDSTFTVRPKNSETITEAMPAAKSDVQFQLRTNAVLISGDGSFLTVPGWGVDGTASTTKVDTVILDDRPTDAEYIVQFTVPLKNLLNIGVYNTDLSTDKLYKIVKKSNASLFDTPGAGTFTLFSDLTTSKTISGTVDYNASTHEATVNFTVDLDDTTKEDVFLEAILRINLDPLKKYVGTDLVDKYSLVALKHDVTCDHLPGNEKADEVPFSPSSLNDVSFPKYWIDDATFGQGFKIYKQENAFVKKPGEPYNFTDNGRGVIFKDNNNLYHIANGQRRIKDICILKVIEDDTVSEPVELYPAGETATPGAFDTQIIYNDISEGKYKLVSRIYKDTIVEIKAEVFINQNDISTTEPFYQGGDIGAINTLLVVTDEMNMTNYNSVKTQLENLSSPIDEVILDFGDNNANSWEVEPTSSKPGILIQKVYFDENGVGEFKISAYRGAKNYFIQFNLVDVKPYQYYAQYSRYIKLGYTEEQADESARGAVGDALISSSSNSAAHFRGTFPPKLKLNVPHMWRPLIDLSTSAKRELGSYTVTGEYVQQPGLDKNDIGNYPYEVFTLEEARQEAAKPYNPVDKGGYPRIQRNGIYSTWIKVNPPGGTSFYIIANGQSAVQDLLETNTSNFPHNTRTVRWGGVIDTIRFGVPYTVNAQRSLTDDQPITTYNGIPNPVFKNEYITDIELERSSDAMGDGRSERELILYEKVTNL